jgi:hypothetical protein
LSKKAVPAVATVNVTGIVLDKPVWAVTTICPV